MTTGRVVSLCFGLAAAVLLHQAGFPSGYEVRDLAGVISAVNATLLGFLVSTGALLYAVSNTRLARNLQRTGHFSALLGDLFSAAGAFLLALIASLASLFLKDTLIGESPVAWSTAGALVMVFATTLGVCLLVPLGHKMWLLLSSIRPEEQALE